MSARQSKVAKARAALTSRLATLDAEGQRLRNAHNLLEQATRREAELIEARANELVEDLRDKLTRAETDIEHLRLVRGDLVAQLDRMKTGRELDQGRMDARSVRQTATIHRLETEVAHHEGNATFWRNVALAAGTLAIIFGGLLGNQLI